MLKGNIKNKIEPTVKAFINLSFTRYESLVLAILTVIGTATVKEIHEHTDVPLPKVYQTLDDLLRKNFIKQHSKTRPVQFTAYSPNIILRKIQEQNRRSEEELKVELNRITALSPQSFIGDISPFTGIEALKRIGASIIENVDKELSVAMSPTTLSLFTKELADAKKRGTHLRSMIFTILTMLNPSLESNEYRKLGFNHYLIDLPFKSKPSKDFLDVAKKISSIIDFLGIMISDAGETLFILPLFPHKSYFGIWIFSKIIVEKQIIAYNELFKFARKARETNSF